MNIQSDPPLSQVYTTKTQFDGKDYIRKRLASSHYWVEASGTDWESVLIKKVIWDNKRGK